MLRAHLPVSAPVFDGVTPAILPASVGVRSLWTRVWSLDTFSLFAHVAGLASKLVVAIADLGGKLRVLRARCDVRDVETDTVVSKEVTILTIKTDLVYRIAETLGPLGGNLHVLAFVRQGLTHFS